MNRYADSVSDRSTNRRRWIQLCGAASVGGLAGCLGGDDGDGSDPSDDDPGGGGEEGTSDGADDDGSDGDSIQLTADEGWKDVHDGVEIPDEPGTAILKIGGERITLPTPIAIAEEDPAGTGVTGAETFEARATSMGGEYGGYEISVEFTRVIGFPDTSGTWAESDAVTFSRSQDNRHLGTVIYRRFEDGRLADEESSGELDGRRFVDDPFVNVSRDGVVTIVEDIASSEDESLDGEFQFGARFPDGWDEM